MLLLICYSRMKKEFLNLLLCVCVLSPVTHILSFLPSVPLLILPAARFAPFLFLHPSVSIVVALDLSVALCGPPQIEFLPKLFQDKRKWLVFYIFLSQYITLLFITCIVLETASHTSVCTLQFHMD